MEGSRAFPSGEASPFRGVAAPEARLPDGLDVELGRRLRSWRKGRGLSQVALGDLVGLSGHQIHKYERGFNRLSVSMLVRICRVLGCEFSNVVVEIEGLARRDELCPT